MVSSKVTASGATVSLEGLAGFTTVHRVKARVTSMHGATALQSACTQKVSAEFSAGSKVGVSDRIRAITACDISKSSEEFLRWSDCRVSSNSLD